MKHGHTALIQWTRGNGGFLQGQYSREHTWTFDGGVTVPASASPSVVPVPFSNPANVDPEEAYVAAISSCHMLWFLHLASRAGFQIDRYEDAAIGEMAKNSTGAFWISQVTLQPRISWSGSKIPTAQDETLLHHKSHEQCFIANSVRTKINVVPASASASETTSL